MTATTASLFEPISYKLFKTDPKAFADKIGASFRETGFAVIKDHPIDQGVIDRGVDAGKKFFALPEATKKPVLHPRRRRSARLYALRHRDRQGRQGEGPEGILARRARTAQGPQVRARSWARTFTSPKCRAGRKTPTPCTRRWIRSGCEILSAIAMNLKLDPRFFDNTVQDGNSILRLLHYPPQTEPPPEGSVRAGAHEDINVITLLLGAEEGGLEVLHRNGSWIPVNPPAGARWWCNVGDMLQRLTNHVLPSTTHRVVNPKPERSRFPRYSTPFFLHFQSDYVIKTLPGTITPSGRTVIPSR